jgi:hypothetical protein
MAEEKESYKGLWIGLGIMVVVVVGIIVIAANSSDSSTPNVADNTVTPSVPTSPAPIDNSQADQAAAPSPAVTPQQSQTDSSQITASDIAPYLSGIVEVLCKKMDVNGVEQINDTGSGSLWSLPNGNYDVVTNEHVVAGNDDCILWIPNPSGNQKGAYYLDLANNKSWNSISDEAVIPILSPSQSASYSWSVADVGVYDIPVSQLNYSISSLQDCPSSMPANSPVTVIGYPAFSSVNVQGNLYGAFKNQITTNGVISGNYSLPQNTTLPYSNYYISATIDSGNSGGIALSKNTDGLCLLGIPTWITLTGNYTNEGIVQNIKNVMWVAGD